MHVKYPFDFLRGQRCWDQDSGCFICRSCHFWSKYFWRFECQCLQLLLLVPKDLKNQWWYPNSLLKGSFIVAVQSECCIAWQIIFCGVNCFIFHNASHKLSLPLFIGMHINTWKGNLLWRNFIFHKKFISHYGM